ncbi:hypothetical protein ACFQL1_21370 [Halomicroarcula sp. GCM10025709]|uniref:hypothetical protein n=1 Tax=Haloarcula TaxID=2237 RepID=UPI0024C3C32D|nr:hypothetical protein [Halomicroarcula sp. YJ-61-S]
MIAVLAGSADNFPVAAGLFTVALALVHLRTGRLKVTVFGRNRQLLSAAGGATVAYVFVLLLPEVSETALTVGELRGEALIAEQYVYLLALFGFVAFYGVEVAVAHRSGNTEGSSLVFWAHVAVFALYSGVIGYLLFHQEVRGLSNLFFYALAMGLHFGITDYGLRRHHGDEFDRTGRWVLAGATLLGGGVGVAVELGDLLVATLFGFLAGAIVLNVIKEELPDLSESRFVAFAAGAVLYTVVLLFA